MSLWRHGIISDRPQAYIHSRMRRRTADFLQGKIIPTHTLRSAVLLTTHSPPKSKARQRGKGAQDGQWTDFQSPRRLKQSLLGTPRRGEFLPCLKRHEKIGVIVTLVIGLLDGGRMIERGQQGVVLFVTCPYSAPVDKRVWMAQK